MHNLTKRPTLTLIRGLPGSGKSTIAKVHFKPEGYIHLEADMYYVDESGIYRFDANQLNQAHDWCQNATEQALRQGSDVVVSNTFVQLWELEPYKVMANRYQASINIIEAKGDYASIHDVPDKTIRAMKRKWHVIPKQWRKEMKVTQYGK